MDNLAHSLVGLTAAKAGLERWSPATAVVCVVAANASDIDVLTLFTGGRWSALHYHRGLTHSIVGTAVLGILIPTSFWLGDLLLGALRKRKPVIRYRGLLAASLIAAATHPLMDWTNNYGVRLMLPWNGRWSYGDLMFIVDPYFWLIVGAAAFLLTSNRTSKLIAWCVLAALVSAVLFLATSGRAALAHPYLVRAIWFGTIFVIAVVRATHTGQKLGPRLAITSLLLVGVYWMILSGAHLRAYGETVARANHLASQQNERVIKSAAMPTAADPSRWLSVVETDRAIYRFSVDLRNLNTESGFQRYEKSDPNDAAIMLAERDPRAQIFLGFARFPVTRLSDENCIGQTVVQFADIRYNEPGQARSNFSLEVPVACPQK